MGSEGYSTEVELVQRDELEKSGAKFTGFVTRVEQTFDGIKFITLLCVYELGGAMVDLNLDHYYITGIWWRTSEDEDSPIDAVGFSHGDEEQNEAFETIQELLKVEEGNDQVAGRAEEMILLKGSPRRMEIELTMLKSPTVKRNIAVLKVDSPRGNFEHFSVKGRAWKATGELEKNTTNIMNSDIWFISKSMQYRGGNGQPTTTYYNDRNPIRQKVAWEKLVTFMEHMQPAELRVLEKWEPAVPDEDDESYLYGGASSHYTARVPSHYQQKPYVPPKPVVAMFRVSGDDLGKLIHLDTCEVEVARPLDERCLSLEEYVQKKGDAGTEDEQGDTEVSAQVGSNSTEDQKSSANSEPDASDAASGTASAGNYCDCNSPVCCICNDETEQLAIMFGSHGGLLH